MRTIWVAVLLRIDGLSEVAEVLRFRCSWLASASLLKCIAAEVHLHQSCAGAHRAGPAGTDIVSSLPRKSVRRVFAVMSRKRDRADCKLRHLLVRATTAAAPPPQQQPGAWVRF